MRSFTKSFINLESSFKRPDSALFPSVWLTFKTRDTDCDVTFTVGDLPIERYEDALQFMANNYLVDEPMCKYRDVLKEKESLNSYFVLWRLVMKQKLVLACFKEGSDEIVGLNMTGVFHKNDLGSPKVEVKGKAAIDIFCAKDYIRSFFDVFDFYKVDKFMNSYGLSVGKKYQGRGIATRILEARIPLGKAIGVDLSHSLFAAIGSQIPAERVGFELNYDIMYDDLAAVREDFNFPQADTQSVKLMTLRLNK